MAVDILSSVLAAVGGAVTVSTGVLAVRAFGNARLLAEAAPTPVNALEEGLHEVAGRLEATDALRAPVTGRACLYCRLLLEQRRRNRWETVLDQKESVATRLTDDTGALDLALDATDVVVSSPDRVRTGVFSVPSAELTELLSRVTAPSAPPAGPFLRWREEILLPGDRVFAVGVTTAQHGVWLLGAGDSPALVSDREEVEVVRHQRRAGQRWTAVGLLGLAALVYGGLGLV